jgi:hypothetical protein
MRVGLNGWQRIGIVVSIVWVIGGFLWGNYVSIEQNAQPAVEHYQTCLSLHSDKKPDCAQRFGTEYEEAIKYHWLEAATFALVPIPVAWLLIWALVAIVRWIGHGFKMRRAPPSLPQGQKNTPREATPG